MLDGIHIRELIELKQEGAYWDFKREWYKEGCQADMLLDIICFANNLANRDCYIIIGVDEEKDFKLNDIRQDKNRRNTQNLVTFLRDKKFAGGVRPVVLVESIFLDAVILDVIVIKNSKNTPFYLTEQFRDVKACHIYTRVNDTNTPRDKTADINNIEYLWKKRFNLNETPFNKFFYYLQDVENWKTSADETEDIEYYDKAPEFTLHTFEESRDGYEYYLFSQTDARPHWYSIQLRYYQTVLDSYLIIMMDGYRWRAVAPEHSSLGTICDYSMHEETYYSFYTKDSLRYILHSYFGGSKKVPTDYARYMETILLFESNEERILFEEFAYKNIDKLKKLAKEQRLPYMENLLDYDMENFKKKYKIGMALNNLLDEFRKRNR